jgi:ABC-2 type transport system permease protein
MNKIFLVLKREFLSRVQKKTFLLATIGLPVLIFGIYALMIYFTVSDADSKEKYAIIDKAGLFDSLPQGKKWNQFVFLNNENPETFKTQFDKDYTGFFFVPQGYDIHKNTLDTVVYYGKTQPGIDRKYGIEKMINDAVFKKLLAEAKISTTQIDSAKKDVSLKTLTLEKGVEKSGSAEAASALGLVSGFLIYFLIFIYGSQVMMGVMEEKTSKVAEVMVSSVKPFQLMMGKILGIGAVGLVQFLIWLGLMFVLNLFLPMLMPNLSEQMMSQAGGASAEMQAGAMSKVSAMLAGMPIGTILLCFPIFFLGGYFLYSSLFAAVGSSVNESPQEAQQLSLPITMPIIFSMVIMMKAMKAPNSALAVGASLFPFSSPIVMMARLPFGVPAWQIILSIVLLILGFVGTTWLAAKIYRTGILMYGKKPTWKEMIKWAFRKN